MDARTDKLFHEHPAEVESAEDVNAAIRGLWQDVCSDFPNATTPLVARKVAEEIGVSVARVFEAFPARKDTV